MTQQVFISYSNENETDRQVADRIYNTLKARGIPCWTAHRDIEAGQKWPTEISKAISNSRVMIVVLSEHTQKSSYVEMEVTQAAEEKLTIIPFCIGKVSLSGGLKLLLGICQWINAYSLPQDKDLEQLVETLHRCLGIESEKVLKKEETLREVYIMPDFLRDLKSKSWVVKKNENDSWEVYYKTYDITMIYIPPGKFMMGADNGADDEKPAHEVDLDDYWIGKYEVTFAQYDRYCEETEKGKPDDRGWGREKRPVINVSWGDAGAYCDWLSGKTGLEFKLPTEAQWEKAARGTRGFVYPWGNNVDINKCNSYESGLGRTTPVGAYPSGRSPYGCMDMAGNVCEWCSDWYDKDYYKISPAKNPWGPTDGSDRVLRDGGWYSSNIYCKAACRYKFHPTVQFINLGFRLMMII